MFVKIKYFKNCQGDGETVYSNVTRAFLKEQIPEPPEKDITKLNLALDFDGQTQLIEIPYNYDGYNTEIYYMNDNGKTIERYQF